jgi:hypothetical protein
VRRAAVIGLALALLASGLAVAKKKHHHGKLPRGPYPSLGACSVFPKSSAATNASSAADESAWNQDVSQAPLDPNSASYIAYINAHGGDLVHPDFGSPREYGFPYAVVGKKQKRTKVNFTAYGDESTHGAYRVPLKALVEGGQASDGDRHVLAVDRKRCKLFELYRAFAQKRPKPHWNADGGVIWDLRSAALRPDGFTSADAAGLPIFAGLARFDEAAAGRIDHALRVTVSSSRDAWIPRLALRRLDRAAPTRRPMGLRLRLNGGYDIWDHGTGARDRRRPQAVRADRRGQRIRTGSSPAPPTAAGRTRTSTSSSRFPARPSRWCRARRPCTPADGLAACTPIL